MKSKVYFIVIFCFILVLGFKDLRKNNQANKKWSTFKHVPTTSDVINYLEALNRLTNSISEHEIDIDINSYFGLLLVNVNLKRALREKREALPRKLVTYVKDIIWKTEDLMNSFKQSVNHNQHLINKNYKAIFSLLVNRTTWVNRIPNFHRTRLNIPAAYLEKVYKNWILYKKYVDDRNSWLPNPQQSDLCLASLASAQEVQVGNSWRCSVFKSCYEMVEIGTNFGYALAHRLLFLQQAKFGRGCNVFSEQEDKEMSRRFCSTAYQEAKYIARHDFGIIDLLLEYVCLCALDGHAQFLKRSWLKNILRFQTPSGCFSPYSKILSYDHGLSVYCDGHTTAVAAGSLAIASRFILQTYY